ncbi:integral membrane protein [Colletotrichum incanum]|uniref:Integral membrane protein n=1 Tax=Colletotrichum incanum TaxID=1573173 RepID=A0A161VZ24_COLIC|nr:integral membrane protein [Colletotrichum incanum]OHW98704.1 integral membrane protein [Colletotrichum incanum]
MNSTNGTAAGPIDAAWASESNTQRIVAIVTIFHAFALMSVGLRVYVRVWVIRAAGLDDFVIVLSAASPIINFLCAIGGWSVFIVQANHGLGKHFQTIDKTTDYVTFQHGAFWQTVISATGALMWLKVSIALSLLRLSTTRWFKWALYTTLAITFIYCIGGMLILFTTCKPMSGYWNKYTTPPPKCHGPDYVNNFGIVNTAFNIFTDIILSTLHVPIIWHLQMKRKLKLYAIGILSLGYFAVAMGIVKAYYQINFDSEPDKTFNRSIQFWGFLQLQVGIIAACAPSLKPLVNRLLHLSSHSEPAHGPYSKHSKPTSSGLRSLEQRSVRSGTREQPRRNQYELQNFINTMGDTTATTIFANEGPVNEDTAIPGRIPDFGNFKGIVKTMEFSVTQQGRGDRT